MQYACRSWLEPTTLVKRTTPIRAMGDVPYIPANNPTIYIFRVPTRTFMVELAGNCGVCGRVAAGFIPRWSGRRGADRREGPRPFMDITS